MFCIVIFSHSARQSIAEVKALQMQNWPQNWRLLCFFAIMTPFWGGIAPPEILDSENIFTLLPLEGSSPYVQRIFCHSDGIKVMQMDNFLKNTKKQAIFAHFGKTSLSGPKLQGGGFGNSFFLIHGLIVVHHTSFGNWPHCWIKIHFPATLEIPVDKTVQII